MTSRIGVVVSLFAVAFAGCAVGGGDGTGTSESALRRTCGGFAGFACPSGLVCVDDPRDSCDPMAGGADCGGICRRAHRTRCDYSDPSRIYYGYDTAECSTLRFYCDAGTYFADACGCGCEGVCVQTALCVRGYHWDETTCACVPDAAGVTCGSRVCGAGEVCCNASCGVCAPPDGVCTQQVCEPATI